MKTDESDLTRHILQRVEEIYRLMGTSVPEEWLSSDMTVTQLRMLLLLQSFGPLRMSDIAAKLQVTLPTTTIIVNNLVRKNMAQREANPQDRRLVICKLSPEGQKLINKLWDSGRIAIEKLLEGFTAEQMQKTAEMAELFYRNALDFAKTNK